MSLTFVIGLYIQRSLYFIYMDAMIWRDPLVALAIKRCDSADD